MTSRVFGRGGFSRRKVLAAGAVLPLVAGAAMAQGTPVPGHGEHVTPPATPLPDNQAQMDAYAASGSLTATQFMDGDAIDRVTVQIPAIDFTGEGTSASLPIDPVQYIYRFHDSEVDAPEGVAKPFQYVEIDWNTEGEPRGPNGSFVSPHFDFHYYTLTLDEMNKQLTCGSSNGKTCDPMLTSYEQMRLFQLMPEPQYVPDTYFADVGSAIPIMGLHLLDGTAEYTVEAVNHTPVLIYGTFNGAVIFAEASVTLNTLQDVVAAPGQQLSWSYAQPAAFQEAISWPTEFVLTYLPDTGGFEAGFAGFVEHEAG